MADSVEFGVWRAEGHLPVVEYSRAAMEEIRLAVLEGFVSVARVGLEVGGVLFGTVDGNTVRILASRRIPCEHAHGPSFLLSEKDEAGLAELLQSSQTDPRLTGLRPVGWYHSHTRSEIALSKEDRRIFDTYFPEQRQVALVLKVGKFLPTRAGFFLREPDGVIHADSTCREFVVEPYRKPAPMAVHAPSRLHTPAPSPLPRPERRLPPLEPPAFLIRRPPSRPPVWNWLFVVLLCAGLAGAGVLVKPYVPAGPEQIPLRFTDTQGQLRIEWDRDCRAVREADGASLQLTEGATKAQKTIELNVEHLRKGSITYMRRSEDVGIRMTIYRTGKQPLEELTRFVGQPVRPKPTKLDRIRKENEELDTQAGKLDQALRDELARSRRLQRAIRALAAEPKP